MTITLTRCSVNDMTTATTYPPQLLRTLAWYPSEETDTARAFALGQIYGIARTLGLDPANIYLATADTVGDYDPHEVEDAELVLATHSFATYLRAHGADNVRITTAQDEANRLDV